MWAGFVVMLDEFGREMVEMVLAENIEMVEALNYHALIAWLDERSLG
jgi:hypothetical protein